MTIPTGLVLPIISDEYKFQELCRDLWARKFPAAHVQQYARRGQSQDGIDVSVIDEVSKLVIGIQCKATGDPETPLTEAEINACVAAAKSFVPTLTQFKIATTRKTDKGTQDIANRISAENVKNGSFPVEVLSWAELLSELKFFRELIEAYFPQFDWSGLTAEQEGQLTLASSYLEKYRVRDAEALTASMRSRAWTISEPKIKARIITIEANAKILLGLEEEGASLLREAYQLDPHNETRLCNYAHVCCLNGNTSEAVTVLERVIKTNPKNEQAYAILVGIWASSLSLEEIVGRVPEELQTSYRVASSIAGVARAVGEVETAISWQKRAVDAAAPQVIGDISASLGELYLLSILSVKNFSANEAPNAEQKQRIQKSVEHLENAIACIEDSTVLNTRHPWLFNCSVGHAILGNAEKAIEYVTRALEFEPSNPLYLSHRAKLEFQKSGTAAKKYLDKIPAESRITGDWALLYSESLRKEGKKKEAIQVLQTFLKQSSEAAFRREAYRLLFSLLIDTKDAVAGEALLADPDISQLGDTQLVILKAQLLLLKKQAEAAKELALKLESQANENLDFALRRELGKLLHNVDEFSLAAKQFKILQAQSHDKNVRLMVLDNLYRAGEHKEALELAQKILAEDGPSRFASEIATTICELGNKLEDGLRICTDYLRDNPNDDLMKVHLAIVLYRKGDVAEAKRLVEEEINPKELPPKGCLNLARLTGALGNVEHALNLTYEARRAHFNDSEVHNTFISAYFVATQQPDVLKSPTVVERDCAVQLQNRGVTTWVVIEDREDLKTEISEHGLDHPTVKAIWNLKCGDEVSLMLGTVEPEKFKIVQICDKRAYSAYESMEKFAERFPNDSGPLRMMVPREKGKVEVEFNPLFKVAAKQATHAKECLNLYNSGLIPVGAFAEMLNKHLTDIVCALIHGEGTSLYSCLGNAEEAQEHLNALSNKDSKLVFDLTAIASLVHLGAGELVGCQVKGRAFVTQSTIDILRSEISFHESTRRKGYSVLSMDEGLPFLQEITKEQVDAQLAFLKNLDQWISSYARVDTSGAELSLDWKEKEKLNEILGANFIDSLLAAGQPGSVLISDDSQLRILGANEFGVRGAWTGNLLLSLSQEGALSSEQVEDYFIQAIANKYKHVPINPSLLLRSVKKTAWLLESPATAVISSFEDPAWLLPTIIDAAARFLVDLWLASVPITRRDAIALAVLESLSKDRDPDVIAVLMKRHIPRYLKLLPFFQAEMMQLIDSWLTHRRAA
ncbi:MAG: hypothetical protein J0M12_09085 [Deltaproteobacteria bacterium]|nr:hypothetical protein [Deltaproteobacteria bacterium]